MHIVAMAWLFVILLMALTFSSVVAGIAFFLFVGLSPMVLLALLAARRHRARRGQQSTVENDVPGADNRDPKADQ